MLLLSRVVTIFLVNVASSIFAVQVKRSWEIDNWSNRCVLPVCPKHANYEVTGVMETWHGEQWPTELVFTCWPGYILVGSRIIECYDGMWSDNTPQCVVSSPVLPTQHSQHQVVPHQQQFVGHSQQPEPYPQSVVPHPQLGLPQPQQHVSQPQQPVPQPQQPVPHSPYPLSQPQQPLQFPQQPVSQQQPFIPQQRPGINNYCSCDTPSQKLFSQQQQPTLKGRGEQLKKTSEATGGCILPPYPANGTYKLTTVMNPVASSHRLTANLTYSCGSIIKEGPDSIICLEGRWSDNFPFCRDRRPDDTKVTSASSAGGFDATLKELPWHVGIYDKGFTPYMQICGGSIISRNIVLSAAHCFWDDLEMLRPASQFAVGAGKLYRDWDDIRDRTNAQKFDVRDIKIPPRYQHLTASYQEDIAVLTVSNDFMMNSFVAPAILDFDPVLDAKHLQEGNLGRVGGWGLITEDGREATVLQVVMLPYVGIEKCITQNEPSFRNYITADKICAGYRNGTAVCMGDSGGGLIYTENENGTPRHYIRGIVSTAPTNDNACNIYAWTTFTHLLRQDHFIQPLLTA